MLRVFPLLQTGQVLHYYFLFAVSLEQDTFRISLGENPNSGFSWDMNSIQTSHHFEIFYTPVISRQLNEITSPRPFCSKASRQNKPTNQVGPLRPPLISPVTHTHTQLESESKHFNLLTQKIFEYICICVKAALSVTETKAGVHNPRFRA